MPTFLSDPPDSLYLVLAAALIIAALVWFNRRGRKARIALSVLLLLSTLVIALDFFFESPREEAVRRVKSMAQAADKRDRDAFASQLAETITYQDESRTVTLTREQLRKHAFWDVLHNLDVHVATWDFSRADVKEIDANTIEIGFLGKGELRDGKPFPVYMRATFAKQADGQMRLTALASYDALERTRKRLSIPGLSPPP